MRFSIGFELESASRETLAGVVERFESTFPLASWIAPDQLHIVTKFLGGMSPKQRRKVAAILEEVGAGIAPFTLACSKTMCFPTDGPPRVIVAPVVDASGMMQRFMGECDRAVEAAGVATADPSFTPHIVLGRADNRAFKDKNSLKKAVASQSFPAFSQLISGSSVISSKLQKSGPLYTFDKKCLFKANVVS